MGRELFKADPHISTATPPIQEFRITRLTTNAKLVESKQAGGRKPERPKFVNGTKIIIIKGKKEKSPAAACPRFGGSRKKRGVACLVEWHAWKMGVTILRIPIACSQRRSLCLSSSSGVNALQGTSYMC